MKNTILKIAGVKNPEALYKKYATEDDFLKAYPKFALGGKMNIKAMQKFELGGNEEIITPTTNSNRQTYAKTIIYSPEEWHQKNILAGNVMLGKNNDLNTMFKNNIYPQYTLPNDTVPINYSPVVKQLPMPQGFVDNSKSTFNYAAGQQLPKQANGGQMNFQTMPQFASGGSIFKDIGAGLYGVGEGLLDTVTLGATDQITDMGYKALQKAGGSTENEIRQQDSIHGFSQAAGAIGGAVINPAGTGAAIGQTGKGLGEGISRGNESEEWARNTGQALNAAGAIGSIAYGNFGAAGTSGAANAGANAAGNASKLTGQSAKFAGSDFGKFAQTAGKYGSIAGQMGSVLQPMFNQQYGNNQGYKMGGQMKYAMGGEIQYANGGTGEINAEVEDNENAIGPNGEFTQFNGPTHAQGGIETDMAPGTMIFSDKLKMPGSKKSFADLNKLYDTNKEDDVLSSEKSNNTLKLTAMLMRDAKLKQSLALFQEQEQFKQDKVAAYAKRMGVQIPSQDNEQMEPQGMPEQSEGEYKNGGININPANKGKFTASAENAGMGVQEFANHVLANKEDYSSTQVKRANFAHNAAGWKHEMGGFNPMSQGFIQGINSYQVGGNTDPGKLSDIQRQLKVVKQQISTLQPDSSFVSGPLAKLRGLEKDLTIRQNNHPEFKKAMGGRLPMYQDGRMTPMEENDNIYLDAPSRRTYNITEHPYLKNQYLLPYGKELAINENETGAPISLGNQTIQSKTLGTPIQTNNDSGSNFYNNQFYDENYVPPLNPVPPKGEGFDWANAGKQVGNFALQNAGNLYDLFRSTQDNSKLNLARYSPDLLDKTQDLANNQRMYSEGKRQTAEASQGNASTYLNNMYANRASKLANDLNVNTTYGNLNAQIANAAKLYNAGAIDKETMFKLQAEGMNRNLKGQALAGMSQNFLNQGLTNDKTSMDEKTLNLFTKNMKDPTFRKDLLEFMNKKESKVKE